jgi:hypothetical protein
MNFMLVSSVDATWAVIWQKSPDIVMAMVRFSDGTTASEICAADTLPEAFEEWRGLYNSLHLAKVDDLASALAYLDRPTEEAESLTELRLRESFPADTTV